MFAVIRVGGNQYRVSPGDNITVSHLQGQIGDMVQCEALLVAEGENVKLAADAKAVPVSAKIVEQGQGEKIHVRRFRAKSRFRKHVGFRAQLTKITIETIGQTKKANEPVSVPKTEVETVKAATPASTQKRTKKIGA